MLKRGIIDFLTPDDYHPRVETITPGLLFQPWDDNHQGLKNR